MYSRLHQSILIFLGGKRNDRFETKMEGTGPVPAIALPSWFLGKIFPIVGGAVIAILAGMVLTGFIRHKEHLEPGIKFTSKKILQWAVILDRKSVV